MRRSTTIPRGWYTVKRPDVRRSGPLHTPRGREIVAQNANEKVDLDEQTKKQGNIGRKTSFRGKNEERDHTLSLT